MSSNFVIPDLKQILTGADGTMTVGSAARGETPVDKTLRASVIIVNYNGKQKLLECLESVGRTLSPDCELIVVDNASSDGSAAAVETQFSDVMLIRSKTNCGFGSGNNLGVLSSRGKYLVFLNPDTLVESGWLEALLAPFEINDRAGMVTARILLADQPDRINACGNSVHLTGLTLCRGMGQPRGALDKPEEVDAVSGAAFAIRRELFDTLGGFDEDTFLYMEDTDLSLRARLAGWRCLYAPDSIVLHYYRLKITPLKVFYQERNRYLMLLKSLKFATLTVLIPAQLLAEVISWGFVLMSDRANLRNKLRAYQWVILNWAVIMRKRKLTQSLRQVSDRELLLHTGFRLDFRQTNHGKIAMLAQIIFTPLFLVLRLMTLAVVWW